MDEPFRLPSGLETLYAAFAGYVAEEDLLPLLRGGAVLGLSGGADSTLLLYLLKAASVEWSFPLYALHLEHGIRGEEAMADAAFCTELCRALEVPLTVCHADIPALAERRGEGIEVCARRERYDLLEKERQKQTAACIVTAHNATDQAETVLLHLLRGSGLRGLCGIRPWRGVLVRPLLFAEGDRIRQALEIAGVPYRTDATNADTTYARNYVRQEILPRLVRVNSAAVKSLCRTAQNLWQEEDVLAGMAQERLAAAVQGGQASRGALAALPPALFARVLQAWTAPFAPPGEGPEQVHCGRLYALLQTGGHRFSFPLPGGLLLLAEGDVLTLRNQKTEAPPPFSIPLKMGENLLPDGCMLYVGDAQNKNDETVRNIYKLSIQAHLPSATIKDGWIARSRAEGDAYRFRDHTHTLRKLFSDRKLPMALRRVLPVLCDGSGILWVPFFPVRAFPPGTETVPVTYYTNQRFNKEEEKNEKPK